MALVIALITLLVALVGFAWWVIYHRRFIRKVIEENKREEKRKIWEAVPYDS